MPVAVYQPRAREKEVDPLDTIIKGLSIASTIYGIKDAGEKRDLLAKQNEMMSSQRDFQNKTELAGRGLKQDENGNVIEDTGSSFYQQRMRKGEPDPVAHQLKQMQLRDAQAKADERANGAKLPATEAVALGSSNSAYQALGDAGKAFEANKDISGPVQGRWSRILAAGEVGDTGKQAKSFDAQLKMNAQIIGKSLEGGKLTDQDIERYKDMLPNLNDSPDAAKNKIAVLQNMLSQKQQAESSALGQAGYNVRNIKMSAPTDNPNFGGLRDKIGSMQDPMLPNAGASEKPNAIKQGGHTYYLNPKTGKYE